MDQERIISVVGLGYVGLPVAVYMSEKYETIGFDINESRIAELKQGKDSTLEVTSEQLATAKIHFTSQTDELAKANFHIVAVPTPVNESNQPDMSILVAASKSVGQALKEGDIVVYESTVYPGATEEICIPELERVSGLKAGKDFFVGYSPERINPGDKEHTFQKITKVVSAQNEQTLKVISQVYSSVVTAGVHEASSIKVAEAAKVIENTQRDINIALMNELSVIFSRLGIDTNEVLEAAGTKWNFLPFRPGLVGGHCIGVDPYYLTHKAEVVGYHPEVILSGRKINDSMPDFISTQIVKEMVKRGCVERPVVNVYGVTFKENCPDLRNSKVANLIQGLKDYNLDVCVHDPYADSVEAYEEYGIELKCYEEMPVANVVVVAVAHDFYLTRKSELISKCYNKGIFFDVKAIYGRDQECFGGRQVIRL